MVFITKIITLAVMIWHLLDVQLISTLSLRNSYLHRLIYSGNGEYYYQYCTGGKTGYTESALATLISFSERDGRRFVTVVMKCNPTTESYRDTILLDEFCYNKYKLCKPLVDFTLPSPNSSSTELLTNYYDDLDHEMPLYYINQSYSFYIRSHIDDSEIEKQVEFQNLRLRKILLEL